MRPRNGDLRVRAAGCASGSAPSSSSPASIGAELDAWHGLVLGGLPRPSDHSHWALQLVLVLLMPVAARDNDGHAPWRLRRTACIQGEVLRLSVRALREPTHVRRLPFPTD